MSKEDFEVATLGQKKVLNMADIFAAPDVQYREVEAWGGLVRLGSLTAEEMIAFVEVNAADEKQRRIAGIRMIVRSLVNEANERIGQDEHVAGLLKKDAAATNKLIEAVMEMNGLKAPKAEEVKKD